MSSGKHPKTHTPTDADLRRNPGIGTSKGTEREGDRLDGDATFEGDVMNDVTPEGGVDPDQTGRTNR